MSREKLMESKDTFREQMKERLAELTSDEKQQYLEGLVHAFDAVTRFCDPEEITPFERETFIGSALSMAYSETHNLKLDSETRMRPLVENNMRAVFANYTFAALVQLELLRVPLNIEESVRLQSISILAANTA